MKLENIIKPYPTNHSKHDKLIKNVSSMTETSPNVLTIAMNAYYKLKDKSILCGWLEGDIDLLQMLRDNNKYEFYNWKEVPFANVTLLLYEMKSNDTTKNYHKALSQLKKSKNMILKYTDYKSIDCFYAFNVGNSFLFRFEEV